MAKEEQGISEEEEDDDGDYNDESLRILVRNSVAWRKRELVICKTWKHGNNIPPCILQNNTKPCEHTNFLYRISTYIYRVVMATSWYPKFMITDYKWS